MPYKCPFCELIPSTHSLTKLAENEACIYYYTCPAKALSYNDVSSAVQHFEGVWDEIPPHKEWVWILDGTGFTFQHAMQIELTVAIAKLILKYSKNLKRVVVIHSTPSITLTHAMITPFLKGIRVDVDHKIKRAEELCV
jgi:hypothetical protein